MDNTSEPKKKSRKAADMGSPKRPPGRPLIVNWSAITGRADNWRGIFGHVWESLWPSLSTAQSVDDVHNALTNVLQYEGEFKPVVPLMFKVLKDSKFPRTKQGRINYLADSLAGLGKVTPRSSRDICAKERAKRKREHRIIRYEFYVECSCGHKGPSLNHACPLCEAKIPEEWF